VLAAIRTLNRLESVGETLRATLNAIASIAPQWLQEHALPEWYDRYSHRIEESRLPKGQVERQLSAELIGFDGSHLLSMVYESATSPFLKELPAVQTLRHTWVFQYYADNGSLRWRKAEDLPPAGMRYDSPYDPQAHYGNKRSITW
jgi:transposase